LAEAYRHAYRGKLPKTTIDRNISNYMAFKNGELRGKALKLFLRRTAFCKREGNNKGDNGRPRMIVMMSVRDTIEGVQIGELYEAFYRSEGGQAYQVKGATEAEFAAKVEDVSSGDHTSTDFSAFEASINPRMRCEIEAYMTQRLCEKAGFRRTARTMRRVQAKRLKIVLRGGGFLYLCTRASGNFETSFGNGLINHCLISFCWACHGGSPDHLPKHVCEGDDGLVPQGIMDADILKDLGIEFSSALRAGSPGRVDFLSCRFVDGLRYPDIVKVCNSLLWAHGASHLKRSKQLFLIRQKAYSAWMLYKDHPIIGALIVKIGELTSGMSAFKGYEKYLNTWKGEGRCAIRDFPRHFSPRFERRVVVAEGGLGFPPVDLVCQHEAERLIRKADWSFFSLLQDWAKLDDLRVSARLLTGPLGTMAKPAVFTASHYQEFLDTLDAFGYDTELLRNRGPPSGPEGWTHDSV
jgi:hypothetical protein